MFLKNIWADKRLWNHGMTAFFGVHLVLTVASLTLGTIIGVLGIRALRVSDRSQRSWVVQSAIVPSESTTAACKGSSVESGHRVAC